MITMERCSPIRRALDAIREVANPELITELEYLIEDEEEAIKTAYEDGADFALLSVLLDDDYPTADEYFDEFFND